MPANLKFWPADPFLPMLPTPSPSPTGSQTGQSAPGLDWPGQAWPGLDWPGRLSSVDAYRGFVMILMVAELLQFYRLHEAFPASPLWAFLTDQQSHVAWAGCSLHDLIQPSFSFLVGVVLPYSIAGQTGRGRSFGQQVSRALRRALVLVLLGIFLRSTHATQTYFTFEDTLTQIGLGYPFLFLLGHARPRTGWVALALILCGYWIAFVLYPRPGQVWPELGFNYEAVGVPRTWPEHYPGLMAHFNKNSNLAWAFDTWFLNLFPRESPFRFNEGGYATLSFIPTLGTMILGLQAGRWLRAGWPPRDLLKRLLVAGTIGLTGGVLLHVVGICPVVKRIWTPAWVLFSGGWCFYLLALFYGAIDVAGRKAWANPRRANPRRANPRWAFPRWAFPLIVVGTNSIAIYCLVHLIDRFIIHSLYIHLGHRPFGVFGPAYEPLLIGAATMLVFYLILWWMYRRRLFIRI